MSDKGRRCVSDCAWLALKYSRFHRQAHKQYRVHNRRNNERFHPTVPAVPYLKPLIRYGRNSSFQASYICRRSFRNCEQAATIHQEMRLRRLQWRHIFRLS